MVSPPCIDDHLLKEEEMKSVGDMSQVCPQMVLKMLKLGTFWETLFFNGQWTNLLVQSRNGQSLWQTLCAFDLLRSSHTWIEAILLCGTPSTTLQTWIVSRDWFCRDIWRLKINIRMGLVYFRKSNVRTNKLDVQETNLCITLLQKLKWFLWMQVCAWTEFQHLIFGT